MSLQRAFYDVRHVWARNAAKRCDDPFRADAPMNRLLISEASPTIDVGDLLDRQSLGWFRIRIIILCSVVALLDGFDVQVIGIAAPSMAATLSIPIKAVGAVFSATLLGLALGAMGLGILSDRFGRKHVLTFATATFGIFTIWTACATSFDQLLLVRFLAGVGLGGAMPSFIGMASDYAPRHRRGVIVGLLWTGFPVGGMVAGIVSTHLIGAFGWQSLFYAGGVFPILLAIVLASALPESLIFLVRSGVEPQRILGMLSRMHIEIPAPEKVRFVARGFSPASPVGLLFTEGRAWATMLLWACFFATFLMLITNVVWTPTLLQKAGLSVAGASLVLAAFNLGSIVGTSIAGLLMGARGPRAALPFAFLCCAIILGYFGQLDVSSHLILPAQAAAGLFLGAGSSALIALSALLYPASVRSTGVGWAMAVGRLGSFVGPLVISMFVSWNWPIGSIFLTFAIPALFTTICIACIRFPNQAEPALSHIP
jgi:AAHS family 4-hydroxybenzoate transporter-like MFS transporter